jgi:quinol monooxygenase YgiN
VLGRLSEEVGREPGNQLYTVVRSDADPNTFAIHELFNDRDALRAHQKNERLGPLGAELQELVESVTMSIGEVIAPGGDT